MVVKMNLQVDLFSNLNGDLADCVVIWQLCRVRCCRSPCTSSSPTTGRRSVNSNSAASFHSLVVNNEFKNGWYKLFLPVILCFFHVDHSPSDNMVLRFWLTSAVIHVSLANDKEERCVLKGLRKYSEYWISVEAYNEVGTGPRSSPAVISITLEDGQFTFF